MIFEMFIYAINYRCKQTMEQGQDCKPDQESSHITTRETDASSNDTSVGSSADTESVKQLQESPSENPKENENTVAKNGQENKETQESVDSNTGANAEGDTQEENEYMIPQREILVPNEIETVWEKSQVKL